MQGADCDARPDPGAAEMKRIAPPRSSRELLYGAGAGPAHRKLENRVHGGQWFSDEVHASDGQAPAVQARRPLWPGQSTLAGRSSIIIELFGPAACGKTTLARALKRALADRGVPVLLVTSSRPAEKGLKEAHGVAVMAASLSRVSKLVTALGALTSGVSAEPLVAHLMELLPPRGWTRSLRVRRYLRNLCRSWSAALTSHNVVIFDQGFMNSLCSLALFSGFVDRNNLARGLSLVPEPDLLVRLDTPREVLQTRLERRLQGQAMIERLFERDIETALRQVELSSHLDDLLAERGRHPLHVSWRDSDGLARAVEAIVDEIMSRRGGITA
jgi:thymidylate kinase